MAILRAEGLEAYYTDGQESQPFLLDALDASEEEIQRILEDKIKEAIK